MKKLLLFFTLASCFVITTSMQDDDGADISFTNTVHDFGTVRQGASVRCIFKFKNTGNLPLVLTSGTAPCLCVKVDGSREQIMPHSTGVVKVTFDATTAGKFNRPLTVTSNAINHHGSVTLYVKGTVAAK